MRSSHAGRVSRVHSKAAWTGPCGDVTSCFAVIRLRCNLFSLLRSRSDSLHVRKHYRVRVCSIESALVNGILRLHFGFLLTLDDPCNIRLSATTRSYGPRDAWHRSRDACDFATPAARVRRHSEYAQAKRATGLFHQRCRRSPANIDPSACEIPERARIRARQDVAWQWSYCQRR